MRFHIITLFPEMFDSYINESILARAQKNKLIEFKFYNPRDYTKPTKIQKLKDKPYLRIDDKPYGGGPGMLIQAEPVGYAVDNAISSIKKKKKSKFQIIHLSPSAKKFNTAKAKYFSEKNTDLIIVCGRYEGIDCRIKKIHKGIELSIGDFVLTGGELPAMIIADCVSRQVKGVLGDIGSLEERRIASSEVYTRPESLIYKGKTYKVPKILLSGHHKNIDSWKLSKNQEK